MGKTAANAAGGQWFESRQRQIFVEKKKVKLILTRLDLRCCATKAYYSVNSLAHVLSDVVYTISIKNGTGIRTTRCGVLGIAI